LLDLVVLPRCLGVLAQLLVCQRVAKAGHNPVGGIGGGAVEVEDH
jgi:hypothetical protein